jgi:hypothetical protein
MDKAYKERGMEAFMALVDTCDVLAFRPFFDLTIPAGVAKEILRARITSKPVLELQSSTLSRTLSVEATRAKLKELGRKEQ